VTRRTLISGASAALLHQALKAQRGPLHHPAGNRYAIPGNSLARWNFHRLGQSLSEGATISAVPDDSGSGNGLSISPIQSAQSPMFTATAMSGRGGYWAGANPPGGSASSSPACAATGAFQSPNIALAETPLSVLYCGQYGSNGTAGSNGGILAVGPISMSHRNQNSTWPISVLWYNPTSNHGSTGNGNVQLFAGPVCGAVVNGFGGTPAQTRWMSNRTRLTTSNSWSASTNWNSPVYVGYSPFSGVNMPCGCIHHEIAIYNRALTDAELDMWQVYCNQMYGTPLYLYNGGSGSLSYIDRRVVFVGASTLGGQNAVLAGTMPDYVDGILGNWSHVEYINYGVGSATLANYVSNLSTYTALYDGSLGAGHHIAVYGDYRNDYNAGLTYTQLYTNLTSFWRSLQSAGFKVIASTMITSSGDPTAVTQFRDSLNALILANSAGIDGVVNTTPSGPDPGFQSYFDANEPGHWNSVGYHRWAALAAPVVASLL
jgi:hypothetical protein